jgi:hypothetical protein
MIFRGVTEFPSSYTYMTQLDTMVINYFRHFYVIYQFLE